MKIGCLAPLEPSINALIDIFANVGYGSWSVGTPENFKVTVALAVNWILNNFAHASAKQGLFSQTQTSDALFPGAFPANFFRYMDGSIVPQKSTQDPLTDNAIIAVDGQIDPVVYAQQLTVPHFGTMTPQKFVGYNTSSFAFFSSNAFTYCACLSALAKWAKLYGITPRG